MALIRSANDHLLGRHRPSHAGTFPIHVKPERDTEFRPLPPATGKSPFHLDLKAILPPDDYATILKKKKLTSHLNGDMGGIKFDVPQILVAKGMEADIDPKADAGDRSAFLYILGDCVYFNGEVSQYYNQFYQPYEFYPGPIFAVPGNHDGENFPGANALEGFVRNFCAPKGGEDAGIGRFPPDRHGATERLLDLADSGGQFGGPVQQCAGWGRHPSAPDGLAGLSAEDPAENDARNRDAPSPHLCPPTITIQAART